MSTTPTVAASSDRPSFPPRSHPSLSPSSSTSVVVLETTSSAILSPTERQLDSIPLSASSEKSASPITTSDKSDFVETPAVSNKRARIELYSTAPSTSRSSAESSSTCSCSEESPLFGLTLSQEHCKRQDYLSWQEYFFATALLSSRRSKDPYHPSGACLVDPDNRICGIGYNGFPSGFPDDKLSWQDASPDGVDDPDSWLESREPYVIPAEVNCLLNSVKTARGTTLYCVDFPNNDSAKHIVQSRRVSKVVYCRLPSVLSDSHRVSRLLLQQAGIAVESYQLPRPIELSLTDQEEIERSSPVQSFLSWDEYFMAMALLTSRRSKDPNTQVGACIVSPRRIILACGYNGLTHGCSDDAFPWQRSAPDPKHTKYPYVCHAEVNAIHNCEADQEGSTLYVTLFPCYQCARDIIQVGIRRIVYLKDPYHDDVKFRASRRLLDMAKVDYQAFQPSRKGVTLTLAPES